LTAKKQQAKFVHYSIDNGSVADPDPVLFYPPDTGSGSGMLLSRITDFVGGGKIKNRVTRLVFV
jgi:hypothetical protein